MDAAQLLIAPEVRRHLGERATSDLANRIQPSGDCPVCHTTLTDSQVSITVHTAATDPLLVMPAHASCQPSSLIIHPAGRRPAAPPTEYHFTVFVLPVVPAGEEASSNPQVWGVPAILLNPEVDVQVGDVVDGRWQAWWEKTAELVGLTQLTPDHPMPEADVTTWAAQVSTTRGRGRITLHGPALQYQLVDVQADLLDRMRYAGRCLLLFCGSVPAAPVIDMSLLAAAMRSGSVYGAWAKLGGQPTSAVFPHPDEREMADRVAPPGAQIMRSTADLERQLDDRDVCAKVTFSDDPALRLSWTIPDQPRQPFPVLLLEPRRMIGMARGDSGVKTEARVEMVIGSGMHRLTTADTAPDVARDWHARPTSSGVELTNPFGQVIATGAVSIPNRWREQASATGNVIVIFGPMIGVRSPEGRPYDDLDRHAELQNSRRLGFAAAGQVTWADPGLHGHSHLDSASTVEDGHHDPDLDALATEKLQRISSYSITVADSLATTIAPEQLQPWLTRLWPVNCQTCGFALGTKAEVNIDHVKGRDEVIVSMHHATCRPSGTPPVNLTSPTCSLTAGCLGEGQGGEPSDTDLPVAVVNPSCEHLVLRHEKGGDWQDVTLSQFRHLRFTAPNGQFPRQARHTSARVTGQRLTITTTSRRSARTSWSLDGCPEHVLRQIVRAGGIAVALTTTALPARLGHDDLPITFNDPASLIAWVRLRTS
ncbi:hypothetical protein [Catenuloplanes indicus]|uniref:Uncharacterized protein n=1 Tax=Catenuloplanes indicus TaxID=137267 RepID=A0AAE3W117_9ACTN|nr:hypothetical protein [Catenuloplanes indicus]MDQ0366952.1 hypothetical protein [Catenuloplanes indicus]